MTKEIKETEVLDEKIDGHVTQEIDHVEVTKEEEPMAEDTRTASDVQEDAMAPSSVMNSEDDLSTAEVKASEMTTNILAGVSHDVFDQLTKKNQQFLISLDRQLHDELHYQVQEKAYKEIAETLLEGQDQSQTAKQIYGTPTELAKVIREQGLHPENHDTPERSSDLLLGIDGGLFLGSLFTLVTGTTMMMRNAEVNGALVGILSIIINYILAGFSMLATAKNLPNPHAPKGKKGYAKYFIISVLSMFAWFILVSMSSVMLPRVINPVLPGYIYLLIGAATLAYRYYFKRRYQVKGGVF